MVDSSAICSREHASFLNNDNNLLPDALHTQQCHAPFDTLIANFGLA
jgi:hypothetical protein